MSDLDDPPKPQRRKQVVAAAGRGGRRVHKSTGFDIVVGVGLVTYGIVHLLIAWIAVRIELTGVRSSDSQDEALSAMAQTVFGEVLLWITVFGLGALTLWQGVRDDLAAGSAGNPAEQDLWPARVLVQRHRLPDARHQRCPGGIRRACGTRRPADRD